MIRRLWVQLSLAFSVLVLISASLLLILLVSYAEIQRQTSTDERNQPVNDDWLYGERGIATQIQAYFDEGGTVDGAILLLASIESNQPSSALPDLRLRLTGGETVYGRLSPNAMYEQVILDSVILEYDTGRNRNSGLPPGVLPPINLFMFLGVVGVTMGILFGVIISRWLAAPLSRLADTVRQAGSRDFNLRIEPEGSEEIQEVARAFNEMAAQLETSEKLRSNLVADVAHELRTPLTVMENNLRALIDDVHPLTKTEVLTLYDQTRHLTRLVNDLHELSLADAHELSIVRELLDFNNFLSPIAEIFKPIAEAETIDFIVEIPADPLTVSGDQVRLRQVVQNLLVNALRHTPSGGEITLRLEPQGKQVCLKVIDTGDGIAEEDLDYVFERFYRTDKARNRADGGTGLGLAIGKAIIEAHGGEISVSSRTTSPSGTCFTIYLPVFHSRYGI